MRELKFRAWDKDAAKYVDGVGELYVDILEVETKVFRIEQMCPARYIIEQYTGLKDKNGKEIYEGDIVEYDWYIMSGKPAYRVKKQVVFNDMGARVGNDRIRNCSNVEVIGNIHENPELLGGEE